MFTAYGWDYSGSAVPRPLPLGEKLGQRNGKCFGCFLGHMVGRVDAVAAHVIGPVSPDCERVAVEVLKIVSPGPEHQQRRPYAVSCRPVGLLVLPVDGEASPVVLEHRPDHVRISRGLPPLVVVLAPHCFGIAAVPTVRIRIDYPLRDLRLSEEEPVPPSGGELGGGPGKVLAERDAIEQRKPRYRPGMIEREPEGDITPSVMTGQSETAVTERIHDRHHVARDRPLAVRGVIQGRRRPARPAVSAKVRADDREAALDEPWSDSMPRGRGSRV